MMKRLMSQQESQRRKLPQWLLVRKDRLLDPKRQNLMLDLRLLSLLLALKKDLRNHNLLQDHKKLNLIMGPKRISQLLENHFQSLKKIVLLLVSNHKKVAPPLDKYLKEGVKLNKVQPLEMEVLMMRLLF